MATETPEKSAGSEKKVEAGVALLEIMMAVDAWEEFAQAQLERFKDEAVPMSYSWPSRKRLQCMHELMDILAHRLGMTED